MVLEQPIGAKARRARERSRELAVHLRGARLGSDAPLGRPELGDAGIGELGRAERARLVDDVARQPTLNREELLARVRRGGQPQANFVTTTRAGQLLRAQMAPVLSAATDEAAPTTGEAVAGTANGVPAPVAGGTPERTITGFILMLDNITRNFENESRRDQMLHDLTEGNRATLANIRAAAEMLDFADLTEEMRARFSKVVRDEVEAMSRRLDDSAHQFADSLKARWPLEEMLGADLIAATRRRIEQRLALRTKDEEIDETVWVKVDSFSLMQALTYLASRLSDEFEVREVRFRLSAHGRLVHLDLIWSGQAMSTETVMGWELESMRIEGESKDRALAEGDWILLPAHCRHRVTWTRAQPPTVWLAIHFR